MKCPGCGADLRHSINDLPVYVRGDQLGIKCLLCRIWIPVGEIKNIPLTMESK